MRSTTDRHGIFERDRPNGTEVRVQIAMTNNPQINYSHPRKAKYVMELSGTALGVPLNNRKIPT
jgi:hypothetical protein